MAIEDSMVKDKKNRQEPRKAFSIKAAERLGKVLAEDIEVQVETGDAVHVFGPIKKSGSSRQKVADKLVNQFEKILSNGSEQTLRRALALLQSIDDEQLARSLARRQNFVVLRRGADGKLIIDETRLGPRQAKASFSPGGGTGSTGPGSKGKGEK